MVAPGYIPPKGTWRAFPKTWFGIHYEYDFISRVERFPFICLDMVAVFENVSEVNTWKYN